jgi:hypothetical protein
MNKLNYSQLAVIILISVFGFLSCSNNNAHNIVNKMIQAHNDKNVEKEISFYSDDATYELIRSKNTYEGKRKIQKHLEWDAAVNSYFITKSFSINSDTVKCDLKEVTDWTTSLGIDTVYYEYMQIVVMNGLIKELKLMETKSTAAKYDSQGADLMEWAQLKRPELLAELKENDNYIASKETAHKWIHLAKEWHKSTKDN